VNYAMIFNALTLTPKDDRQHNVGPSESNGDSAGGTGVVQDNDRAPVVIQPLPWENAPKADGSTTEFEERLEECHEFMHHFAMHTPHFFLGHVAKSAKAQALESATSRAQRSVTTQVQGGATTNAAKKRKVHYADEDEEG
jgi:hypothetical protein